MAIEEPLIPPATRDRLAKAKAKVLGLNHPCTLEQLFYMMEDLFPELWPQLVWLDRNYPELPLH